MAAAVHTGCAAHPTRHSPCTHPARTLHAPCTHPARTLHAHPAPFTSYPAPCALHPAPCALQAWLRRCALLSQPLWWWHAHARANAATRAALAPAILGMLSCRMARSWRTWTAAAAVAGRARGWARLLTNPAARARRHAFSTWRAHAVALSAVRAAVQRVLAHWMRRKASQTWAAWVSWRVAAVVTRERGSVAVRRMLYASSVRALRPCTAAPLPLHRCTAAAPPLHRRCTAAAPPLHPSTFLCYTSAPLRLLLTSIAPHPRTPAPPQHLCAPCAPLRHFRPRAAATAPPPPRLRATAPAPLQVRVLLCWRAVTAARSLPLMALTQWCRGAEARALNTLRASGAARAACRRALHRTLNHRLAAATRTWRGAAAAAAAQRERAYAAVARWWQGLLSAAWNSWVARAAAAAHVRQLLARACLVRAGSVQLRVLRAWRVVLDEADASAAEAGRYATP